MPDLSEHDTGEFETVPPPGPSEGRADVTRLRLEVAARTDAGLVREHNEDHFIAARLGRSMSVLATNLPAGQVPARVDEAAYALAVADGMGGAAAGEVASALALTLGTELTVDEARWPVRLDEAEVERLRERVTEYFHAIDRAVTERARARPDLRGMGTTLTVAYSAGPELVVFQVGDSRAYLVRGGTLERITRDQTVAQALVDAGHLAPAEAESHHLRHVLTKAIGTGDCCDEAVMHRVGVAPGDRLLLCTDGLTDMVTDADIGALLARHPEPEAACEALVAAALAGGGRDNVTVIVGRYAEDA